MLPWEGENQLRTDVSVDMGLNGQISRACPWGRGLRTNEARHTPSNASLRPLLPVP